MIRFFIGQMLEHNDPDFGRGYVIALDAINHKITLYWPIDGTVSVYNQSTGVLRVEGSGFMPFEVGGIVQSTGIAYRPTAIAALPSGEYDILEIHPTERVGVVVRLRGSPMTTRIAACQVKKFIEPPSRDIAQVLFDGPFIRPIIGCAAGLQPAQN